MKRGLEMGSTQHATKLVSINVRNARGHALNWLVASCEREEYRPETVVDGIGHWHEAHRYDSDGAQGQPIIDREGITIRCIGRNIEGFVWLASLYDQDEDDGVEGETSLIAAMRCYVIGRMGETVAVPKEFT